MRTKTALGFFFSDMFFSSIDSILIATHPNSVVFMSSIELDIKDVDENQFGSPYVNFHSIKKIFAFPKVATAT